MHKDGRWPHPLLRLTSAPACHFPVVLRARRRVAQETVGSQDLLQPGRRFGGEVVIALWLGVRVVPVEQLPVGVVDLLFGGIRDDS
jgi:hypothetical protein